MKQRKYEKPSIEVLEVPELMQAGPNATSNPNNNPGEPITTQPGDNPGDDGEGMAKPGKFMEEQSQSFWK